MKQTASKVQSKRHSVPTTVLPKLKTNVGNSTTLVARVVHSDHSILCMDLVLGVDVDVVMIQILMVEIMNY